MEDGVEIISEYRMMLHLHKLALSIPLGPKYMDPGGSEPTANAAKEIRLSVAH